MCRYVIYAIMLTLAAHAHAANVSEAVLQRLDEQIEKRNDYDAIKLARIDSLKSEFAQCSELNEKILLTNSIAHEYESFISDSAYRYYSLLLKYSTEIGDDASVLTSRIGMAKVLAVSGMFRESTAIFESIQADNIPDSVKIEYYAARRQLCDFMRAYAEGVGDDYESEYYSESRRYRDLLLPLLNPESPFAKFLYSEVLQDQHRYAEARTLLQGIADAEKSHSRLKALAYSALAGISLLEGNENNALHYWVESAISDMAVSNKENTSLQNVALYLYASGDIERAYKYISVSTDDANFCDAKLRNVQMSKHLPIINDAYQKLISRQQRSLILWLIIVSLLAVVLGLGVFYILKQNKRLTVVRHSLSQANETKSVYLRHFLELCTVSMERLDTYNKTVSRKLEIGKIEELKKLTKSAYQAAERNKVFYDNFDDAFLHIYPNFVSEFNNLLRDDERIDVEHGVLTTELRIFALNRMGITDGTHIASFLRLSVNTIYAYRNRIRNKAKNRETFDVDVLKIGDKND